jgi:hypothetical protein
MTEGSRRADHTSKNLREINVKIGNKNSREDLSPLWTSGSEASSQLISPGPQKGLRSIGITSKQCKYTYIHTYKDREHNDV